MALIAAAGAMGTTGVMAADLGGNCCSDLEERIAELEATTARKGNRHVSLTVSGHVNEGIMWWDDGVNSDAYIATNVQSRTRFRFKGKATINSVWSAGFLIEIGMTRPGSSLNVDNEEDDARLADGMDVRHQALWVKSKNLGTLWLGHTSDATDGITQICLGCTMGNYHGVAIGDIAGGFALRDAAGVAAVFDEDPTADPAAVPITVGSLLESAEGQRQAVIKWISPTVAGFALSVNWADEENGTDDGFGIALRFAREFGAIRVGAGVGFEDQGDRQTTGGSLSIAHTPTGLYIAGSIGEEDTADQVDEMWSISGGMNRRLNSLGNTNIGFTYGNFTREAIVSEADAWGFTISQRIDAAALELYIQYHNISATVDDADLQDFDVVFVGARIRF